MGYLCKPQGICGVCSASVPSCTHPDLPVPSAGSHIFLYQVLDLCMTHLDWLSALVRVLQGTVRERQAEGDGGMEENKREITL